MSTLLSARDELARRDLDTLSINFGELLRSRMKDPALTDIMLNGNGSLFEKRTGERITKIGSFSEHHAQSIINLVAAIAGAVVNRGSTIIEAELPIRNARFIGYVPPIVAKPSFTIRLPPSKVHTLFDYARAGIATPRQIEILENVVVEKHNVLISGGTGSGKSTLLNALLEAHHRFHPDLRFGLIEESIELQYLQENVLALRTGPAVDHQDLLKRLMRSFPEGIVFGEVRDRAALQLVKAANTGHEPILSTLHANTPLRALGRMEDLCAEALPVPGATFRNQIADARWVIVGIAQTDPKTRRSDQPERHITEIIRVEGMLNGTYDTAILT